MPDLALLRRGGVRMGTTSTPSNRSALSCCLRAVRIGPESRDIRWLQSVPDAFGSGRGYRPDYFPSISREFNASSRYYFVRWLVLMKSQSRFLTATKRTLVTGKGQTRVVPYYTIMAYSRTAAGTRPLQLLLRMLDTPCCRSIGEDVGETRLIAGMLTRLIN